MLVRNDNKNEILQWLQDLESPQMPDYGINLTNKKKRHLDCGLPSPPTSTGFPMESRSTMVSTPKKRKIIPIDATSASLRDDAENEDVRDTPRASARINARLQHPGDDGSPSSTSTSQTRSRASGRASPTKQLAYLSIDPMGVEVTRLDLDDPTLPAAARALVMKMQDVAAGQGVVDSSLKPAIENMKATSHSYDSFRSYVYDTSNKGDYNHTGAVHTLESVLKIVKDAGECHVLEYDESGWNNFVHTPLIRTAIATWPLDQIGVSPCMNAAIISDWRFNPLVTRKVDYVLFLNPRALMRSQQAVSQQQLSTDAAAALTRLQSTMPEFSVNHTDYNPLRRRPICVSIETKRHGIGQEREAELQLGVWLAAQWKLLADRAGVEEVANLGILPGIVVQGHQWMLIITTYENGKTKIWSNRRFGSTETALETFQVLAGLRELMRWSVEVFAVWYDKHILRPVL